MEFLEGYIDEVLKHFAPAGDPDGPLVPLPAKHEPARVVPEFPLTAYRAMLGLNG